MISSFLLQDIPRHPDTCLFEVREAFKRNLFLGFEAHIRAYIAIFSPPAPSGGLAHPEPLFNALFDFSVANENQLIIISLLN